jgi:hypothetical protein
VKISAGDRKQINIIDNAFGARVSCANRGVVALKARSIKETVMQREIHLSSTLPAFSMTIVHLEELYHHVITLLFDPKEIVFSKIELISDKYQFKTPAELYTFTGVTGPLRTFSISIFGEKGRVSLRCHSFPGSPPTVLATGETDDWCIRAVETVISFLVPHRRWYHRFTGWSMQSFPSNVWFLYIGLPWVFLHVPLVQIFVAAWFAIFVFLAVITFAKGVFLPDAVLYLPEDGHLVRQHA